MIKIGIPSKGRLRKDTLKVFIKKKLKILSERGERDLFGFIKNYKNIKITYLHAREIVERLGDGSLDIGFSGYDLLKESEINIQKKIIVKKKFNFGNATLVIAIPNDWIDVQTVADLEEVSFDFRDKKNTRLRVATKYPNITRRYYEKQGVQAECVKLNGAMELAPSLGLARRIVDLVSTGRTLKENGLVETQPILDITARLIVNRAALKTDSRVADLVEAFRREADARLQAKVAA